MAQNLKKERRRREHIINKHPPPSIKKDSTCTKHNCLLGNFFKLNYKRFFSRFYFFVIQI